MRLTRFAPIAALMIAGAVLAGCAGKSVLEGGPSLTATVENPIGKNELKAVEDAYGIAVKSAVHYGRLGLCPPGTVETFAKPCARPEAIIALNDANQKVRLALVPARRFVKENPNISAFSALQAARTALADFNAELTRVGAR